MKTRRILAVVALTGILGTGAYAASFGGCQKMGFGNDMMNPQFKKFNAPHKMMKKNHKKGEFRILSILRQLNLSDKQRDEVRKIMAEAMKNKVSPSDAFTKNSFDKAKFIKIMKQKRDNMIKSKAETIEKIYKILTPKQKEQLKVLMELKKDRMASMMGKRMNFDKNCNGGR